MNCKIEFYQQQYAVEVYKFFEDFQDYLVNLDPLKRLKRIPGFGEKVLEKTVKEVAQKQGVFYVALVGDKVVGFVVGVLEGQSDEGLLNAHPGIMGRVTELYVDDSFRGQGIGTKLMSKVEQYLKRKDCDYIWVEVFLPNVKTHDLYKKLGYQDRDIDMIKKL